jgi:hypothetical protein
VVQEFGREGVLPYSSFFASNMPFNAPLAGLAWQWLISSIVMICAPPGDAYLFMLNREWSTLRTHFTDHHIAIHFTNPQEIVSSYPLAMINAAIAVGLLLLYTPAYRSWNWKPPVRAPKWAVVFFMLSNIFLATVPLVPPGRGNQPYFHLPYWVRSCSRFSCPCPLLNLPSFWSRAVSCHRRIFDIPIWLGLLVCLVYLASP